MGRPDEQEWQFTCCRPMVLRISRCSGYSRTGQQASCLTLGYGRPQFAAAPHLL